ncbi:uncharacterized protein DS421_16g553740 [Arachis hypogaea]|nr:uncharacterized protein DS421_16g553740 [Arachis hypogaea]
MGGCSYMLRLRFVVSLNIGSTLRGGVSTLWCVFRLYNFLGVCYRCKYMVTPFDYCSVTMTSSRTNLWLWKLLLLP